MNSLVAEPCTTGLFQLGECCRWDEVREELYWIDVISGRFFRATANGSDIEIVKSYELGSYLTALAPMEDRRDGWIVASGQSISLLDESGEMREVACPESRNAPSVRMNDGAADPWGRFWVGSMAFDVTPGQGSLYRFHESIGTELIVADVTISNGIGWSPDRRTMYFIDSGPATIHAFDVDERGNISGKRLFTEFDAPTNGAPDGLCVDATGGVWVAVWGGYQVRGYSPSGQQTAQIDLPTAQPTSCAIGGANGTTLYITTAREGMDEENLAADPNAGRLFCVNVGCTGLPIESYRSQPIERFS